LINPIRGEIWRVDLEPSRGAEMQKTRPAVVINSDNAGRMPMRLIVPLTGWSGMFSGYFWMARIEPTPASGLTKLSAADVFQTRGASLERFSNKIGVLSEEMLAEIAKALALTVEYQP
jgi:mRNA interferase MazF